MGRKVLITGNEISSTIYFQESPTIFQIEGNKW